MMPKIKANGLDFYYEIHGKGVPLILINGLYSNTSNWYAVLKELQNHFQVILYDCRDQGQTEVPVKEYAINEHIKDLNALMEVLGIRQAHIVGISHGSFIAMRFAVSYPEKVLKLGLVSAVSEETAHATYVFEFSNYLRNHYGMKIYYKMLMTYAFGEPYFEKLAPKIEAIADDFERRSKESPSIHRILNVARQHYPFTKDLHKIKAQTIIITGELDRYTPVSRAKIIHQNICHSQLRILKDCGHSVHLEKPDELSQLLIEFMG